MTWSSRAAAITGMGMAIVLFCACSSVPDVHFGDGGTTSSSGGSTSGGSSGAPQPEPLPDWACPGKPPPDGQGICCGNRICLKCSQSDCQKCEQAGCDGTVSAACCKKNPAQTQCRSANDC